MSPPEAPALPCPFCGSTGATPSRTSSGRRLVLCVACGCEGPDAADAAHALQLWNERGPDCTPTPDVARLERELASLFSALDLERPANYDPFVALKLDIGRLQDVERRWFEACAIARAHCPVGDGESHVRQGIPRLAAKTARLTRELEEAKVEATGIRERLQAIVDEQIGPEPILSAEELMTLIERRLFEDRRDRGILERELEEARGALDKLHGLLFAHLPYDEQFNRVWDQMRGIASRARRILAPPSEGEPTTTKED